MEEELFAFVFATLLGGGSMGRYWFRTRSRWHQEQLSESRRVLIDNDTQHRKLNNLMDTLSDVANRLERIETQLEKRPTKSQKRSSKDQKKDAH